jgi:phosphotriesterase-related protein
LLSHDVFLKQMWTRHGGNGFVFIPTVFAAMLAERGTHPTLIDTLLRDNPARMLAGDSGLAPH